ncbi:restriction endonuclease subunit S [Blautia sp.]|uniref:restriction endonuclease subunit S n=1 Tax=Blautia sp. TaxID=1955243 RepID=UPI003A8EC8BC
MAMKESGIEWVGLIPDTWSVIPNKYVMHKEKNLCEKWTSEDVMSLTMNGVIVRDLQNPTGKMPATFDGYQYIEDGDLLMCLFDIDVTPRCVGKVTHNGVTSPAYSNFKVHDNASRDYFYYYYLMVDNTKELLHLAKNLRHSFTEEQLGQLKVPMPPLSEQQAIADYLDETCSQIDEIIAEAKASIDEYKELKQSVIFEAVTKGLNKNVEMKDSGIEWIGEIPVDWVVKKFKYVATVNTNLVSPIGYEDYHQIAPDCIEKDSGRIIKERTVSEAGIESWNQLFKQGQLIYSKIRPTLNKVIIAPYDGLCSADMYPLDVHENIYFVQFAMLSKYFVGQVGLITQDRVKMPKINQDELSNVYVAVPEKTEQKEIVDWLNVQLPKYDSLIAEKESLINDLEAYKKSLIYEVVTGKRRVV